MLFHFLNYNQIQIQERKIQLMDYYKQQMKPSNQKYDEEELIPLTFFHHVKLDVYVQMFHVVHLDLSYE